MAFSKARAAGLTTMSSAAEQVGIHLSVYWRLVKQEHVIPTPTTPLDKRCYYSKQELDNVKQVVKELRQQGVIS